MNIALPALIAFIVLLPGFIARAQIKRAERQSLDYSPFGQVVSEAVVWAFALHGLWIMLLEAFSPWTFRGDLFLALLSSHPQAQSGALQAVGLQFKAVALYFGSVIAAAQLGPMLVRRLITRLRWDRLGSRFSGLMRFSEAPWYYLLSGADFEEDTVPDLIAISAIVDVAGQAYLYTGILDDYFFDTDGKLDRLILQEVSRRPMARDKDASAAGPSPTDRFYRVDGDYFVLRYSEAITLNVEYIKFERAGEGATAPVATD